MEDEPCTHEKWIQHPDTHNIVTCANPKCGEIHQFTPTGVRVLKKSECNSQIEAKKRAIQEEKEVAVKTPSKPTKAKKKRSNPYYKHIFYEDRKDAIIADLLSVGRTATRKKWGIPSGTLSQLEKRWLTPAQRDIVDRVTAGTALQPPADSCPAFPEFNEAWDPSVQAKWLEVYPAVHAALHRKQD